MKNVVIAASLLALLAPGCIEVDDEGPPPPCEIGACPEVGADTSPQDSTADTAVDSTIEDSGSVDSDFDTGSIPTDTGIDSTIDSGTDTATDVGVDASIADTADTAVPMDTATADTADTMIDDTFIADTMLDDTFVADTAVDDAAMGDSISTDASDASPTTCPTGKGSEMVRVTGSGDGGAYSFCVDKYEATNADYAAFLASMPSMSGQPTDCSTNSTYDPSSGWPAASADNNRPVVHVDWCDASAYCKWAGKRLCGKIGGGSFGAGTTENQDVNVSEWGNACRRGDPANHFPYGGTTYDPVACMGNGRTPSATVPVGSLATCEGGYSGLFDLSGNVYEWLNSCLPGTTANCIIAGGSFRSGSFSLNCYQKSTKAKNIGADDTGIRCCAD